MKRIVLVLGLLLALIPFMPGIHIVENAWMIVEAGAGNWVPRNSSVVSFECTKASEGGNTSYCFFGHDWTSYYAVCDPNTKGCRDGFTAFSKTDAEHCTGFDPGNVSTWCDIPR
jgi:hypothetical protein